MEAPADAVIRPRAAALWVLALVRARRGDPEYRPLLDEAHAIATGVGELQYLAQSALVRAEVAWLQGRLADIDEATAGPFELAIQLGEPSFIGELGCWRWRAGLLSRPPERAAEPFAAQIAGNWTSRRLLDRSRLPV